MFLGKHLSGIALSLLLLSNAHAVESGPIVVYFVPFQIETYIPITEASISCNAWEKWEIPASSEAEVSSLVALLEKKGKHAHFNPHMVRAEIVAPKRVYFIDAHGVVANGTSSYKIDRYEFLSFAVSLTPAERESMRDKPPPCD
jgi:hypothetical protein